MNSYFYENLHAKRNRLKSHMTYIDRNASPHFFVALSTTLILWDLHIQEMQGKPGKGLFARHHFLENSQGISSTIQDGFVSIVFTDVAKCVSPSFWVDGRESGRHGNQGRFLIRCSTSLKLVPLFLRSLGKVAHDTIPSQPICVLVSVEIGQTDVSIECLLLLSFNTPCVPYRGIMARNSKQ